MKPLLLLVIAFAIAVSCGLWGIMLLRERRFAAAHDEIVHGLSRGKVKEILAAHHLPITSESDRNIKVVSRVGPANTMMLNIVFDASETVVGKEALDTEF